MRILSKDTDGIKLSETQICELAGVSRQRREGWVDRELLRETPAGGCELTDALAVAQLGALIAALGPTDGVAAWQQVIEEFEDCAIGETVDVLFDLQRKHAMVVGKREMLGELIDHGRPVRLVPLGPLRAEVAAAFDRLRVAVQTRPARAKG